MGMDSFAPGSNNPNCFTVKNIDPEKRTLFIFHYPINYNCTRDLLKIPGVSDSDIRSSLLKGELAHKIRYHEIVVLCSDIDLLQFNATQLAFLQGAGIVNGLQISSSQMAAIEQQDIQLVGTMDGTNTTFMIPAGTWIQNPPYKIIVYKNGVKQVLGDDYTIAQSTPAGYDTVIFAVPPAPTPTPPDIMTADYYIANT